MKKKTYIQGKQYYLLSMIIMIIFVFIFTNCGGGGNGNDLSPTLSPTPTSFTPPANYQAYENDNNGFSLYYPKEFIVRNELIETANTSVLVTKEVTIIASADQTELVWIYIRRLLGDTPDSIASLAPQNATLTKEKINGIQTLSVEIQSEGSITTFYFYKEKLFMLNSNLLSKNIRSNAIYNNIKNSFTVY